MLLKIANPRNYELLTLDSLANMGDFRPSDLELVGWACVRISADMAQKRAIVPRTLLNSFLLHLGPLLSEDEREPLRAIKKVTWKALAWLYPEYMFMAGADGMKLHAVAVFIQGAVEACCRSHESLYTFLPIEVHSFFLMHDQIGHPIRQLCGDDGKGNVWLYRFCKYCWRRSLPNGALCPMHTSQGGASAHAAYQHARRLSPAFTKQINAMVSSEVMAFHQANMDIGVIWPASNTSIWVRKQHPVLLNYLQLQNCANDQFTRQLADALLFMSNSSAQMHREVERMKSVFYEYPVLLWPIAIRAEAWLIADAENSKKYGGYRKNAGRKPKK